MTPLTNDETAILLLCATLGRSGSCARPLTAIGYDRIAGWLRSCGARPGDLLGEDSRLLDALKQSELADVAPIMKELLAGQLAAALRVESWMRIGGWVMTRGSADYPRQFTRLGPKRPPVLFGIGARSLLGKPCLAVVGSRDAPADDEAFAKDMGSAAAAASYAVVSGAARGIDSAAMSGALDAEGTAIGVVADGLANVPSSRSWRKPLVQGNLCMVSAVDPECRFSAGNAMARNKIVYGLAEHAVVIRSSNGSGGTWAGAVEALRAQWCPIHVRCQNEGDAMSAVLGLENQGARPLPNSPAATCVQTILTARPIDTDGRSKNTLWG